MASKIEADIFSKVLPIRLSMGMLLDSLGHSSAIQPTLQCTTSKRELRRPTSPRPRDQPLQVHQNTFGSIKADQ
jgi:hypothetical protein